MNEQPLATVIRRLDPRTLRLLPLNARFMRQETYARLVANIRADGCLTSTPLCWPDPDDGGRLLVLSGNHRVQASIDAELELIDVMVADQDLSRARRVAIQLSHNALEGEDDPALLRQLYDELDAVDWKLYAGFDDAQLKLLAEVKIGSLAEANLAFATITLVFLPDEAARVLEVFEEVRKDLRRADARWLNRMAEYDRLLDSLSEAADASGITNTATALGAVLDIYLRHRQDLALLYAGADPKSDRRVPLSSVLGTDRVPLATAQRLASALARVSGDLPPGQPWLALDRLLEQPPHAA